MKKIIAALFCAMLIVCLCACDEDNASTPEASDTENISEAVSQQESSTVTDESSEDESKEEASSDTSAEESIPEISEEESLEESVPEKQDVTEEEVQQAYQKLSYANLFSFGPVTESRPGIYGGDLENADVKTVLQFVAMLGRDGFLKEYTEYSDVFGYEAAYKAVVPVSVLNGYTADLFGYTYDFTGITAEYEEDPYYDEESDSVVYFYGGGWGYGPIDEYTYTGCTVIDDTTAEVALDFVVVVSEETYETEVDHKAVITIQKQQSGLWKIISFSKV